MAAAAESCKQQHQNLLAVEVKVLSAHELKGSSSLFAGRLRPYAVLSVPTSPDPVHENSSASKRRGGAAVVHRTRVDECGESNPTWGDILQLPFDPSLLLRAVTGDATPAAVHVLVLAKRRGREPAQIGWCRIPASDVVDGLRPASHVRRLSYALRNPRHGGRGHGVIDVAVRLVGPGAAAAAAATSTGANAPPMAPGLAPSRRQALGMPAGYAWSSAVAVGFPVEPHGSPRLNLRDGSKKEEERKRSGGGTDGSTWI